VIDVTAAQQRKSNDWSRFRPGSTTNRERSEKRTAHSIKTQQGLITDVETGVTTQGDTREEALEMLDEAVALHKGEIGREPTDEELRELGIDPEDSTTGDTELPEFMR